MTPILYWATIIAPELSSHSVTALTLDIADKIFIEFYSIFTEVPHFYNEENQLLEIDYSTRQGWTTYRSFCNLIVNLWILCRRSGRKMETDSNNKISRFFFVETSNPSNNPAIVYIPYDWHTFHNHVAWCDFSFVWEVRLNPIILSQQFCEACGQTIPSKDTPGPSNRI